MSEPNSPGGVAEDTNEFEEPAALKGEVASTDVMAASGPSPERAFRRVRRGIGLGSQAAAAVVLSAGLATLAGVLVTGVAASENVASTAPAALPEEAGLEEALLEEAGLEGAGPERASEAVAAAPAPDLTLVGEQLEDLSAELDALRARDLRSQGERLGRDLARSLPRLMKQIRVARDARHKKGQRKRLAGPFSAGELSAAVSSLQINKASGRWLTDRRGRVLAPASVPLPSGVETAAPGNGEASKVWILGAGSERLLVARRCLSREKHCLYESKSVSIEVTEIEQASALLLAAARADGALRAELQSARKQSARKRIANTAAVVANAGLDSRGPLVAAFVSLLLASMLGVWVRRRLLTQSQELSAHVLGLLAGDDERSHSRKVAELASTWEAVDMLGRDLGERRAQRELEQQRHQRWHTWADKLEAIAHGAWHERLEVTGEAGEVAVAEGINHVVAALEQRAGHLQRHLRVLKRSSGPVADDDQTGSDVADDRVPQNNVSQDNVPQDGAVPKLRRRLESLQPMTALLADIAARTKSLALAAPASSSLQAELTRLSGAVAVRARAAQSILDGLGADVTDLDTARGGEALSANEREALAELLQELTQLGAAASVTHDMARAGQFVWAA